MASSPIDHIKDGVYISGWRATQYADEMRKVGIINVLKLYADIPYFPADFNTFENCLDDGIFIPETILKRGVNFIHQQVNAGKPVLVMCGAGISRSSTFVLAYLLETGHDLHDAFDLLREAHPAASPHPQMWSSLITHYQLPYTLTEIIHWL